jgi:hypothetical protein
MKTLGIQEVGLLKTINQLKSSSRSESFPDIEVDTCKTAISGRHAVKNFLTGKWFICGDKVCEPLNAIDNFLRRPKKWSILRRWRNQKVVILVFIFQSRSPLYNGLLTNNRSYIYFTFIKPYFQ